MIGKFIVPILSCSYMYGFYRSWTSPIWKEWNPKEMILRVGFSSVNGFFYIMPPFCIDRYYNLSKRIKDYQKGTITHMDSWSELGFYHPRVL